MSNGYELNDRVIYVLNENINEFMKKMYEKQDIISMSISYNLQDVIMELNVFKNEKIKISFYGNNLFLLDRDNEITSLIVDILNNKEIKTNVIRGMETGNFYLISYERNGRVNYSFAFEITDDIFEIVESVIKSANMGVLNYIEISIGTENDGDYLEFEIGNDKENFNFIVYYLNEVFSSSMIELSIMMSIFDLIKEAIKENDKEKIDRYLVYFMNICCPDLSKIDGFFDKYEKLVKVFNSYIIEMKLNNINQLRLLYDDKGKDLSYLLSDFINEFDENRDAYYSLLKSISMFLVLDR